MREYAFELAMCAAVEADSDGLVARQLGSHTRIVDTVEVLRGPEFSARTEITAEAIPDLAIESDVGVGRARYWKEAFDAPPERAESAVDRAIEIGFFDAERRNGRRYVRQTTRYPDWFSGLRAFENKPDLGRPGDLRLQLRKDVSLGLFDEVVLVTESYVTGAHLNRIPDEVGVWRFDPESGEREVLREPTPLAADGPGVDIVEERSARTDIEVVSAAEKARYRRRVAERAYGKGWRTYDMPACSEAEADERFGTACLPFCRWKDRLVDSASECGPDCGGFEAGDAPEIDLVAERARRQPWKADPPSRKRRQSGLDRFTD